RARAAGEKTLDRWRHNFRFGLAGFVRGNQRPEAIDDDIHGVTHFDQFFFTFHGARHVEFMVKGHEIEYTLREFAIVANRHDEVQPKRADALPFALDGALAQPLAGNLRPDLIFHPGLVLVADPARFARKNQRGLIFERDDDVYITVDDFESGHIKDRALKPRILIAADDERVQSGCLHARANVLVAAIDFCLTWQDNLSGCSRRITRRRLARKSL